MIQAIAPMLDVGGHWLSSNQADQRAIALYLRHYSARHYKDHRRRTQFVPAGEKMVLLTADCQALFVWHHPMPDQQQLRKDGQLGVGCMIFRNESAERSSDLIREADALAWQRWTSEPRHYTYVDRYKVASANPGACFELAGWRYVRVTDECRRCSAARSSGHRPRGHRRTNARGNLYLMEVCR